MNQVAGSAQHLASPATLFDDCHTIDLDGMEVHLIHVGPCHHVGDTIVHVPREGVVFAGDVVYRECTPMGWQGSSRSGCQGLDLIVCSIRRSSSRDTGRPCGIEGAMEMKALPRARARRVEVVLRARQSALEAAKEIELGPYRAWRWPARLYANVESAYREFRNEAAPMPANRHAIATRWSNCEGARARGRVLIRRETKELAMDTLIHPAAATAVAPKPYRAGCVRWQRALGAACAAAALAVPVAGDGGGGGRAPPAEHRHHPWR